MKYVTKFLLAGDKFKSEIHLRHPEFTDSGCGPFTKNKERIPKFKATRDSWYIYKDKLQRSCFQHDMFMEILEIYLEEQLLIKHYVLKHLI